MLHCCDCPQEIDELYKIFQIMGTPNEQTWPGVSQLPDFKVNVGQRHCAKIWAETGLRALWGLQSAIWTSACPVRTRCELGQSCEFFYVSDRLQ